MVPSKTSKRFPHCQGIHDEAATRRRPADPTRHMTQTQVQPPDPQTINGNPSLRIPEKLRPVLTTHHCTGPIYDVNLFVLHTASASRLWLGCYRLLWRRRLLGKVV